MRQIPVDTADATVMVAKAPQPKVRTAVPVRSPPTRSRRHPDGRSTSCSPRQRRGGDPVQLTVPQSGVSDDLAMGTPVALTGLVARPWENEFNGQKRHGIAFRAVAVTSLVAVDSAPKAA
ncbi:Regulatory protein OS=Streptomyces albaduncus OX=68172 GN=FHS32_003818 PE=4 SV=1 [Streptomyces griseoloalbus]